MVDIGVLDHGRQRVLGAARLKLVPHVLFPELCQPGLLRRCSLITFLAPGSDPSIALIVPQPWLPDDRDRSFRTASAALTLDVATI
jgi:hypothetical protein